MTQKGLIKNVHVHFFRQIKWHCIVLITVLPDAASFWLNEKILLCEMHQIWSHCTFLAKICHIEIGVK